MKRKILVLSALCVSVILATSACSIISPLTALELDAVPVYTDAEYIDPSQNSVAATVYRQDQNWVISGHKAESKAYALPGGTTAPQVKAFYAPLLARLGGQVENWFQDDPDALAGNFILDRGAQDITIAYDASSEWPTPILIIRSYVVNGCKRQGANCVVGPKLIRTCPAGLNLQDISTSRPSTEHAGMTSYSHYYCVAPDGTRSEPTNAYEPTPTASKP